jgi:hypothetical protein
VLDLSAFFHQSLITVQVFCLFFLCSKVNSIVLSAGISPRFDVGVKEIKGWAAQLYVRLLMYPVVHFIM